MKKILQLLSSTLVWAFYICTFPILLSAQIIESDQLTEFSPCDETTAISFGQTINASLTSADCQITGGSYIDFYAFNGRAGQQITILMNSSQFDTFLYLLDQNTVIAVDDNGGGGTNSRIALVLPRNGIYIIGANSFDPNTFGNYSVNLAGNSPPSSVKFDFDNDGKADVSVFRPSDGVWYLLQSTAGFAGVQFGISTDKLAPAGYDGDGKTDIAVFRDGNWYLQRSQTGFAAVQFGASGDIPQPADFDGDGRAELAVYRGGNWYTLNLVNGQFAAVQFGIASDKPVVGDYDGDGRADYAVYRDGVWYLLQSTQGFAGVQFGIASDKPVSADYDGDGKTDIAVYRDGVWYQLRSSQGFVSVSFGIATDLPTPADYDGDGKVDAAVFKDGTWYLLQSTNGFAAIPFGLTNDKPIPNAFVP